MDTSYTAVEYFLSFFGSWRDGQDPAVLSLAIIAPAPTSDAPILRAKYAVLGVVVRREARQTWTSDVATVCVIFRVFLSSHALRIGARRSSRALCSLGEPTSFRRGRALPTLTTYASLATCSLAAASQEDRQIIGGLLALHFEKYCPVPHLVSKY